MQAVDKTGVEIIMNNAIREYSLIKEMADYLKEKAGDFVPYVLAILGSGLGNYVKSESVRIAEEIAYSEIPGMPVSTVHGHAGKFVLGYVGEIPVLFMQGRIHLYEGYSEQEVVRPIRAAKLMGVNKLILTNAAGGVNLSFKPGDFMFITDHISSFVSSSLRGENIDRLGTRFPDMTEVYSVRMKEVYDKAVSQIGAEPKMGVYLQTPGPQYETPAEIRMMRNLGADAVGMSTVPEVIVAVHANMRVFGMSIITDLGVEGKIVEVTHEEVQQVANSVQPKMALIMRELISTL